MSRYTVFISHATPEPDEEPESESGELVEVQQKVPAKSEAKELAERTDDPVRMYLREMGSVELLSREDEIAIAKRIEAGREAMIAGLCESLKPEITAERCLRRLSAKKYELLDIEKMLSQAATFSV